ncbi:hypothetical protein ACH40D_41210 [Streptomyces olivaceoviridis]|uniref:Transposase n=1 Tax=Streptomyces olivaceoviridis TaxID=1921 RepID=A0ABW7VIT9_STROI|nr:hypothetical protein [Streptomyces corchorusii]
MVPVIYDPEKLSRAKTGARKDIDYRDERLMVAAGWRCSSPAW